MLAACFHFDSVRKYALTLPMSFMFVCVCVSMCFVYSTLTEAVMFITTNRWHQWIMRDSKAVCVLTKSKLLLDEKWKPEQKEWDGLELVVHCIKIDIDCIVATTYGVVQSMYQQPNEHETLSHANTLSTSPSRYIFKPFTCSTRHDNANASWTYSSSLIVCNDAHDFKNINTFKIDNDDDKRLRDRRTRMHTSFQNS